MTDMQYAGLNTSIRMKEQTLLSKETIQSLLNTSTFEQAIQLLKATVYKDITVDYEQALMQRLIETYQDIDVQSPVPITPVFALVYTYHNAKVLVKMKLAQLSLEHLLIPIGVSLPQLRQAVFADEDAVVSAYLAEAIQSAQSYGEVEWVDILLDQAYFKELLAVARGFDDTIVELVRAWIDLYNVSVVQRLLAKKVSRSVFISVLAEGGYLPIDTLESHFLAQDVSGLMAQVQQMPYVQHLSNQEILDTMDLDLLKDLVSHQYLEKAVLEPFGFLPALAYVYYVEMEVKNVRLLLAGKENDMPVHVIKERVRPSYDI